MDFWDGFIIGYLLTSDKDDENNDSDEFVGSIIWGFIIVIGIIIGLLS